MNSAALKADVLSDVLRAVRLIGAVFFDFELTEPWTVEAPPARDITHIIPGAQRIMEYHFLVRGSCWAGITGEAPARLSEGDLILFPQGDPHVVSSTPGRRSPPNMAVFAQLPVTRPVVYKLGGGGEPAHIVCCFLGCDERPYNPILASLPRVIHLSTRTASATTAWLGKLMISAANEARGERPGSENVLSRLAELLFVEMIRVYVEALPAAQTGWLAGLRDPVVGQALAILHGAPRQPWTVESLARSVGTSRSVLAERFTAMLGTPPMQYLALWRMQLASHLLMRGDPVAAVASDVGYESEAAFSRAFKKLVGQAPATWRKQSQNG